MKTLIFNGSLKINGDTEALIQELACHLNGEVRIITPYNNINPCNDCRYCWENIGCAIKDEMEEIYPLIKTCHNIVLAAPIWFSSLSGPLLNLASRIQSIWTAEHFQKKSFHIKEKKGVIILVGAQNGTETTPTQTALTIMKFMNVHRPSVIKIYSLDTNNLPAGKDESALKKCRETAHMLNNIYNLYK